MPTISYKDFEALCVAGQRYEGEVEGLGYVFWKPKYIGSPVSGMPGQSLYNTPDGTTFTIDMFELMVVPLPDKNNEEELKKEVRKVVLHNNADGSITIKNTSSAMVTVSGGSRIDIQIKDKDKIIISAVDRVTGSSHIIRTDVKGISLALRNDGSPAARLNDLSQLAQIGLSGYGVAKSFEAMSSVPVILGPEYIVVNQGGTIVRNPDRVFTTKGDIASKVGRNLFFFGIAVDVGLATAGVQSWEKAGVNIAINTGIYVVGLACPPLGAALGLTYLFINLISTTPVASSGTYEEIHKSITPADNTRVYVPQILPIEKINRKNTPVIYEGKKYYFEQGRPRY